MNKIIEIIEEIKPGVTVEKDSLLLEDGIMDSFDMIMFVGELNEAFDVEIGAEEFIPENFQSPSTIENLIITLRKG